MSNPNSKPTVPSGGIDSTPLFRMLNPELFMKPNKVIMGFGLIAISGCAVYLTYMNYTHRNVGSEHYIALNEDGTENLRQRKSRWD